MRPEAREPTQHIVSAGWNDELVIGLSNDLSRLRPAHEQIETFLDARGISDRVRQAVALALEEHLTNIISYGFPEGGDHNISVRIGRSEDGSKLAITVEDDGIAFNPMDAPKPDTSVPLEERRIGGLGVLMMRKSMDHLQWERRDEHNVLVMEKAL